MKLAESDRQIAVTPITGRWGWLPALCVASAYGLLLLAFANTGARASTWWAAPLFWIGLLVQFVPITARLIGQDASRRERIGLLMILGLGLYLAKILHSPIAFTFHDELLHWKTANDIAKTGRLFGENSVLPVSPLYPGLEIAANALVSLSGLSTFNAGVIVITSARLVLVLSLYLIYEQISRSEWVAGVATLLYMTNQHFLFFDAMFAYESLALPLALFVIFAVAHRQGKRQGSYIGLTLAILCGIGAVVITHHLTSYTLVAFLILWTLAPMLYRTTKEVVLWYAGEHSTNKLAQFCLEQLVRIDRYVTGDTGQKTRPGPAMPALFGIAASLIWLVYVASLLLAYLSPLLMGAIRELVSFIAAEASSRQLFQDYGGWSAPLWERMLSISLIGLTLLGLLFGLIRIWQHNRYNAVALSLAMATLAYPVSLVTRLTRLGVDVSDRSAAFLYVAIAFVLAVGLVSFRPGNRHKRGFQAVITGLISVIFMGGIIAGAGPIWARLPGPFLVSADARSIGPIGLSTAEWARQYLGSNNRLATDRINRLLMAAYGDQHPVTNVGDKIDVSLLFFSPEFGDAGRKILESGKIRYLVVDRRLSTGLPRVGIYFEEGEPGSFQHIIPLDLAALTKFDQVKDVSRIFDNGDIVIYDVGAFSHGPQ